MTAPPEEIDAKQLLFVYNAQSGLLSALKDGLHKALSPETYPCSLCALTYGAVSMKPTWADFIAALPLPVSFHYRDTASRWLSPKATLPVLLLVNGDSVTTLLSSEAIDACQDLEALMRAVTEANLSR